MAPAVPTPTPAFVFMILILLGWIGTAQFRLAYQVLIGRPLWPEELPPPARHDAKGLLGVLLVWILTNEFASALIPRVPGRTPPASVLMLVSAAANVVLLAVGPWVLARGSGIERSELRLLGPRPGERFWMGVRTWPVVAFWVYAVFFLALKVWGPTSHPVEEWVKSDRSPLAIFLATLTAVGIAPAAEEFLFRGVFLGVATRRALRVPKPDPFEEIVGEQTDSMPKGTERKPWARLWAANIVVSAVFAAMHWRVWPTPVPLFFLSLALGVLYQRTGGIAAPIGLHVVFNGITTLMMNLMLISGVSPENPEKKVLKVVPAASARRDVDADQPKMPTKDTESEKASGKSQTN